LSQNCCLDVQIRFRTPQVPFGRGRKINETLKSEARKKSNLNYHGVEVSKQKVGEFCRRWRIKEFSLFGSILRDDFRQDSDVDILVTFAQNADWKSDDLMEMKEELEGLFGHRVDLVEKHLVEASANYIRKSHILSHKEILYVA